MITVSDKWKDAQKQLLVPEAFIRIKYLATDPDVQPDLTGSSEDAIFYSDTASLVDDVDTLADKYVTLEDGVFLLDYEQEYLPEVYENTGYVSETLSNDDCTFTNHPIIVLTASKVHENPIGGMTLTWSETYNEFPVKYEVIVWNGANLVASYLVENNSNVVNVLEFDYKDFNKITIEIHEWCLPRHRARMEDVMIGVGVTYLKSDLISYENVQSCDVLSGSLPKNSITFKLDNSDGKWNPLNAEGAEKYLLEKQEVTVQYGYNIDGAIEWVDVGTFYLSEWTAKSNGVEASFTASDLFVFMTAIYTGITKGTLYDVCESAFIQANLPLNREGSVKWHLDESLRDYLISFDKDGSNLTIVEVLQLCANAGKCVMAQDHTGKVKIEPQFLQLEDYTINAFNSYSYPEFNFTKQLKAINVNDGLYVHAVAAKGEIQTLNNAFIEDEGHAKEVAEWAAETLKRRQNVKGEIRIDPRLEVGDLVTVESRYGKLHAVGVTKLKTTFTGTFKGSYEGRVLEFSPVDVGYSGELFSGEV